MDHPRDNAPDFEVGAARYFESRVSWVFRLEKDAPALLDDLEAFEGKAIAQPGDNNPVVRGGQCPVHSNNIAVKDAGAGHRSTMHAHKKGADGMSNNQFVHNAFSIGLVATYAESIVL